MERPGGSAEDGAHPSLRARQVLLAGGTADADRPQHCPIALEHNRAGAWDQAMSDLGRIL